MRTTAKPPKAPPVTAPRHRMTWRVRGVIGKFRTPRRRCLKDLERGQAQEGEEENQNTVEGPPEAK